MPLNNTNDILLRRNKVSVLLAQKQSLTKIAKMCNVSIDTILDDKKAIRQDGINFWTALRNKEYIAYNQYMILISIEKVMSKCWNVIESRNDKITQKDKNNCMRLILDAGQYEQRIFTDTPELLDLKELEDKANSVTSNIPLTKDTSKGAKKLKRLLPS